MSGVGHAHDRAIERFRARYAAEPQPLIRAPGRVNLIGEHTDYNDGYVLPMAIDHALWLAIARSGDDTITVVSDDVDGNVNVDPTAIGDRRDGWGAYVQGVVWALTAAGRAVPGWRGAIASDIPAGAGLSSSAALEMSVCRALTLNDRWDPVDAARVGQRAENDWVGVDSGILDQLAVAASRAGNALLIDCRSLEIDHVPLPDGIAVVIMDTTTRRELTGTAYNARRAECTAAAEALGVDALRDADPDAVHQLDDPVLRRRARHVVTENTRTLDAAAAMREGDMARLGDLLNAAHASMRDDFEASSTELDTIVGDAIDTPGCMGARVTGAGFGGCAVALVSQRDVAAFTTAVARAYERQTGLQPRLYVTEAADGIEVVPCG